jgi:hypothetical protein
MPGEREPARRSSVLTDIVRAAEQIGGCRTSYIRLSTSALLASARNTGAVSRKDSPNHE